MNNETPNQANNSYELCLKNPTGEEINENRFNSFYNEAKSFSQSSYRKVDGETVNITSNIENRSFVISSNSREALKQKVKSIAGLAKNKGFEVYESSKTPQNLVTNSKIHTGIKVAELSAEGATPTR